MEESYKIVPEGWINVSKLEDFGRVFNGLSGKKKEDFGYGEPFIPYVNVFKNAKVDIAELDFVNIRKGEKQNEVIYGDIIFTTSSETIEEVGMTSVFLVENGKYYLNSFCFIFRLSDLNWLLPEYAQFLFRSEEVRYKISLLGQGSTRYNISKTRLLKELTFNIPKKVTEQRLIASILSKVDEAISQTEKLIAKYSRIKTGLMQDLLTKGIDEHGNIRSEETHEFKDSPLGKIPVEWEVFLIDELGIWKGGKTPRKSVQKYWDKANNLWFSSKDIIANILDHSYYKISDAAIAETSQTLFPAFKSLIFVFRSGILRHTFPVARSKKDFTVNQDIKVLIPKKEFYSEYLFYMFKQLESLILSSCVKAGTTVESVDGKAFFGLHVGIPKESEQKEIQTILSNIDANLEKSSKALIKLQSIKKGLMQDLLSGKVRVNHLIQEMANV